MALDVPIPPWLHGPQTDPANAYLQAFHIGSQLSMEQARLQEAEVASKRDEQIRERALEANIERAKQEIANRAAYQAASIGVRQQAVDNAMKRTAAYAEKSARQYAANQRFSEGMKNGTYKTPEEGAYDNPDMFIFHGGLGTVLKTRQPQEKVHFGTKGQVIRYTPEGGVETLAPGTPETPKLSEAQKALMGADVAELKGIEKQAGTLEQDKPYFFGLLGSHKDEIAELRKKAADLRETIQKRYAPADQPAALAALSQALAPTPAVAAPAPGAAPLVTAPAGQAPAAKYPDGTVLNHKDGSKWVIQGGVPIPFEAEPETEGELPAQPESMDEETE